MKPEIPLDVQVSLQGLLTRVWAQDDPSALMSVCRLMVDCQAWGLDTADYVGELLEYSTCTARCPFYLSRN